ncbi:MAG: peroxidase family protein [Phycisphaerales bacterium]|nr:peroxidase family protein [Phycisphaerales bacterium]
MANTTLRLAALSGTALALLGTMTVAQDSKKQSAALKSGDRPAESRSQVQRGPRLTKGAQDTTPQQRGGPTTFPSDIRSIDGLNNNIANPEWGAAGIPLNRWIPADYSDGTDSPSGADRPNVRMISNAICDQGGHSVQNSMGLSDYLWQWGQFLDHDIDETPVQSPSESFDIAIPMGDAWFDPFSTGTQTMPLDRSAYVYIDGVRQQLNNITAYIDASNVYGSEDHRASELRTNDGTGKLKTSAGDLLPFNTNNLDNAPTSANPTFFLAGDIRANEQSGLTAMHTLFVREHNRLAEQIALENPSFTGDEIYEHARAFVAAEMQAITFNEFLPRLLGPDAIPAYSGYNPAVDASIANIFATAAYRVGHTMLSSEIKRIEYGGFTSSAGDLDLAAAFFNPSHIQDEGIDSILRGLASQHAQQIDIYVIDDVRNFLFGPPGSGGLDLATLNLQRGRDHGLPSYNEVRVAVGRAPVANFSDINPDPVLIERLEEAYTNVDQVDPWIGLLAEPHRPGAVVGETLMRLLRDQFVNLRDGDRFWYESYLPQPMVDEVNQTTLATIIRANTSINAEIQDDVFIARPACKGDYAAPFGLVDFFDVSVFLDLYSNQQPSADINQDGVLDFFDISEFIQAFHAGCGS